MNSDARFVSLEILCDWQKTHGPVDEIKDRWLSQHAFKDQRDAHLVMALVYGAIRWQGYLDWVLSRFSTHPLSKMKRRTLAALRIGLFQILFLDRIPQSAAINETVNSLRAARQPKWICGFVNGLLRNVARNRDTIPAPGQKDPAIPEHSRLSHPEWLLRKWQNRYGDDKAEEMCRQNNTQPDLCLCVNTVKGTREAFLGRLAEKGIKACLGEYSRQAVRMEGYKGPVHDLPGYHEGLFQVQDEAAQLIVPLLAPFKDGAYLDGCAGSGGKTIQLADMLSGSGRILAVDPNKTRIALLRENLSRAGFVSSTEIIRGRLEELEVRFRGYFSGVLIDAPCSGLGVIRRHPDIRWNRQPGDVMRYQRQQLGLLEGAAEFTKPGGTLVYSTCSTEPEENDAVVSLFLEKHKEFSLTDCKDVLPSQARVLVDTGGFFRTNPADHDLDGFFAARLVKK